MFFQFLLLAIVMTFISGRLIGTKISLGKQVLAALFSVGVTSVVYWFTYLRYRDLNAAGVGELIWIVSMIVVSLLFYLVFEMFDPIALGERGERLTDNRNPFAKLAAWNSRQKRYVQVLYIAVRNGVGKHLTGKRTPETNRKLAVSLCKTLEECGGFFIKFGQVLSTRSDLFPPAFVEELSKLQEDVRKLTSEQVEQIVAAQLKKPREETFASFDMEPLAAASIGQVHRATLKMNNQDVVVKLLRPDISATLNRDLDILVRFAAWASRKSAWAKNIGLLELAKGFSAAMKEEVDFRIEARNFAQVSASMASSRTKVKIPVVYQDISTSKMLVLEYMNGVSVKNGGKVLDELNIDRQEVQRQLFDCILEQIFLHGIFHADPHPGNVYILRDGTPALLDFGSVGRLGTLQQDALKRLLAGFEYKASYMVMDALMQLVESKREIDKEALEHAVSQLLIQSAYGANSSEALIHGLFQIISEFELSFYPMVAGAFRSLVTLEGTMLQLDPHFNLMEEIKRFARTHSLEFMPLGSAKDMKELATNELMSLLPVIRKLPRRLDNIGSMLERGDFTVKVGFFADKTNASFIAQLVAQLLLAFTGAAFGGISLGLLGLAANAKSESSQYMEIFGYFGLTISVILLVRVAVHAVRTIKKWKM